MRPGQQNKRGRGRNNNNNNNNNNGGGGNFNRKGVNPLSRTYDSSGPDVKIRGTAQHIAEKYGALGRDAQSSGDRVMAENYLQHAEHYNRIIAAAQAQMQERYQREERNDTTDRDEDGDFDDQPMAAAPQQQRSQPQQQPQPQREARRPVQETEIAGSGPQPDIDGMPVEVAAAVDNDGPQSDGKDEGKPRRRSAQRPRRQPRRNASADGDTDGAPATAETTAEPTAVAKDDGEAKPAKRPRGGSAAALAAATNE